MRAQAERFGAELITDDVTAVDLTGASRRHRRRGQHLPRARRDPGDGLGLPQARPARRGAALADAASPGAPPATASSSATRTSPSSAAATPRSRRPPSSPGSRKSVTLVHRRDELRGSQDHGRARPGRPEDPLRLELAWSPTSTATTGVDRRRPDRHRHRRDPRAARPGPVRRDRPRPALRAGRAARSSSTPPATCWSTRRAPAPTCPASSPRRPGRPHLPPGDHRRRHRLRRRPRRRALPRRTGGRRAAEPVTARWPDRLTASGGHTWPHVADVTDATFDASRAEVVQAGPGRLLGRLVRALQAAVARSSTSSPATTATRSPS